MFKKIFGIALVFALVFGSQGGVTPATASALDAHWLVSITYQNVGLYATPVSVEFYLEEDSTPITFDPLNGGLLEKNAGASFFIGSVSGLPVGSRSTARMFAIQPLISTIVEFSQDAGFKMRLLSNGFQTADGSTQFMVATTLLNKFERTSVFTIQNLTFSDVTAKVAIYNADSGTLASTVYPLIPANSSKYIDMIHPWDTGLNNITQFNGSAIITVTQGSAIVSEVSEMYYNKNVAANFEGIPLSRSDNTIYMATALCRSYGLDTYYAIQNASMNTSTQVNVFYNNLFGYPNGIDGPYTLGPGQKKSITTCQPSSPPPSGMGGFTGSAKITSSITPIVVIGRAQCSAAPGICPQDKVDVFTAFLGEPKGASKLAAPFVRWANDANYNSPSNVGGKQRATLAIQNLETNQKSVDVQYYNKFGILVATQTLNIPALSKGNSDPYSAGATGKDGMVPGEFGYYTDGTFGGAVIIQANASNPTAKFIAIVRVQNPGAGEDYNAVAVP